MKGASLISLAVLISLAAVAVPCPAAEATSKPTSQRVTEPAKGVQMIEDIEYSRPDGQPQQLDLYLPTAASTGPRPLVIWVHGGGWKGGTRAHPPTLALVKHGFAVASIGYRLSEPVPFAQIQDCKTAVRFLRANAAKYNIDPNRFGAWGHSAGGHLVALLGLANGVKELEGTEFGYPAVSSAVQAVADFSGPTEFKPEMLPANDPRRALTQQASPVSYVGKNNPPFLVYHGGEDKLVPVIQAQKLVELLQAAQSEVTYKEVPGVGHNLGDLLKNGGAEDVLAFFTKHLMTAQPTIAKK